MASQRETLLPQGPALVGVDLVAFVPLPSMSTLLSAARLVPPIVGLVALDAAHSVVATVVAVPSVVALHLVRLAVATRLLSVHLVAVGTLAAGALGAACSLHAAVPVHAVSPLVARVPPVAAVELLHHRYWYDEKGVLDGAAAQRRYQLLAQPLSTSGKRAHRPIWTSRALGYYHTWVWPGQGTSALGRPAQGKLNI